MGYECEIAACHEHLVILSGFVSAPSAEELASAVPEAAAMRPLPDGAVAVFSSADAATEFLARRAPPEAGAGGADGAARPAVAAEVGARPLLLDVGERLGQVSRLYTILYTTLLDTTILLRLRLATIYLPPLPASPAA